MNIKKIWAATWYVVETAAHWPSVDTVEIIFVAPLIIVYTENTILFPYLYWNCYYYLQTIQYYIYRVIQQACSPPIFILKINFFSKSDY